MHASSSFQYRSTASSSYSSSSSHHYSNTRYNSFHGPKQRVLGNWQAGNVAPAWRSSAQGQSQSLRRQQAAGSKILLSQLPLDVGEKEVEGRSKGMAVVVFQRPGDAMIAREKYDGKFVDGRRPIRIELVSDGPAIPTGPSSSSSAPPAPLSLIDRLAKATTPNLSTRNFQKPPTHPKHFDHPNHQLPRQAAAAASIAAAGRPKPFFQSTSIYSTSNPSTSYNSSHVTGPTTSISKRRTKKGPKRLKKQNVHIQFPKFTSGHVTKLAKSKEELDLEMENYRAEADVDFEDEY
ncbi:RNA-binding domain-containing protein [Lentinula novae-zelandiae]|nr:RNA-binding domain-containing protein [Lentinula novae-zelandiae]